MALTNLDRLSLSSSLDATGNITSSSAVSGLVFNGDQMKITPLGGLAVKLLAEEALSEGEIVEVAVGGNSLGVRKCTAGEDWPLGAVYADAASGEDVWIVISGIGMVLPESTVTPTLGDHVYVAAAGGEAGRCGMQASINTNRHWGEVGHALEDATQGSACRCVIHFN